MKKILIILTGVLLVYGEPVIAKNEITIASTIKVAKKAKKKTKKVVKKTKKKSVKVKKVKVKSYRVRYNVGEIQSYMNKLNAEYGWTTEDYTAWLMIVKRESSFNPYAVNKKSGATGLCQALPGKKMAKYGKDWQTNYKTQLRWCRDYIKARYGTPQKAWAFWQSHHWY